MKPTIVKPLLQFLFSLVSMFTEKNPVKVASLDTPVVFSMSRFILFGMAVAALRMVWRIENMGWPDATFAISIVFAPALLNALSKVSPHEALEFGKVMLSRFGIGDVRQPPADHETMIDRAHEVIGAGA